MVSYHLTTAAVEEHAADRAFAKLYLSLGRFVTALASVSRCNNAETLQPVAYISGRL